MSRGSKTAGPDRGCPPPFLGIETWTTISETCLKFLTVNIDPTNSRLKYIQTVSLPPNGRGTFWLDTRIFSELKGNYKLTQTYHSDIENLINMKLGCFTYSFSHFEELLQWFVPRSATPGDS
ncbi:hypothetical protein DFH07DRAFT_773655 [Mycena maculata]|uniref:Uncharacterized protein n=1 Tax=Mycena maculata TaxID=230809 RepID=A0AAD7J2X9_9AGAR|nr:hypothetical protein DFH07DRAFT_773655 [Mycena maculata]